MRSPLLRTVSFINPFTSTPPPYLLPLAPREIHSGHLRRDSDNARSPTLIRARDEASAQFPSAFVETRRGGHKSSQRRRLSLTRQLTVRRCNAYRDSIVDVLGRLAVAARTSVVRRWSPAALEALRLTLPSVNFVVARRLEKWSDTESRAEAAQMYSSGASLAEVLRRYPDAVPNRWNGKPVEPARRAIYAHYALLQEIQGEPDVDPADAAVVETIIRNEGVALACARTGSALTRYRNEWPPLNWYRGQVPESWTTEYEALLSEGRAQDRSPSP